MPPKRKSRSGGDEVARTPDAGLSSGTSVPAPSALSAKDVDSALSRYSSHVDQLSSKSDSKLHELDEWRLNEFSALVRSRDPAYIDKEELKKLMDWKLYVEHLGLCFHN
jgi:hypothetical protein